jgi:hypothetical protein
VIQWTVDRIVHFDPGDFVKAGVVHSVFTTEADACTRSSTAALSRRLVPFRPPRSHRIADGVGRSKISILIRAVFLAQPVAAGSINP